MIQTNFAAAPCSGCSLVTGIVLSLTAFAAAGVPLLLPIPVLILKASMLTQATSAADGASLLLPIPLLLWLCY